MNTPDTRTSDQHPRAMSKDELDPYAPNLRRVKTMGRGPSHEFEEFKKQLELARAVDGRDSYLKYSIKAQEQIAELSTENEFLRAENQRLRTLLEQVVVAKGEDE